MSPDTNGMLAGMGNNFNWTLWIKFIDGAKDQVPVGPSANVEEAKYYLNEHVQSDRYRKPDPPEDKNSSPGPIDKPGKGEGGGSGGGGPQKPGPVGDN